MKLLRKTIFRLSLFLLFVTYSAHSFAQSDPTGKSSPTRTYAITNATIVQSPGKMIEEGTIIFKNGLILSVGKSISIPDDAELIDGTDMYIYPGFIDGMSYTAAKRPEGVPRPDNLFTPDPPNDYAGITPESSVISQIDISDNGIDGLRKIGFTISHTVPYGRMLPGSGSLLLLSDKDHADKLILSENVSMYTQFVGAPGAYPGNTLGIMAKWRNLYTNASYAKNYTQMYAQNPSGMERPSQDRVLEAFYPIVANEKPVFYNAASALEARRAMRLKKELNFKLVIGNLLEGWDLVDEIKNSNTQVFLSLDLPKEPKNSDEDDKSEEVERLEARRMEFYKKYLTQYSLFKQKGVKFGFSTIDATSAKIKENLMLIIENGLSEDDALAALTVDAAALLGIDNVSGTLEPGKIGNAIVSTGPYFSKKSKVKFVFVDGDKYEYDTKTSKKVTEESAQNTSAILGTWNYTSTSPQGEETGKIILEIQDEVLTGTITSNSGRPDADLNNISFSNGLLAFDYSLDAGGQSIEIVVEGMVSGTEFDGEASVSAFNVSFPLVAAKDPESK